MSTHNYESSVLSKKQQYYISEDSKSTTICRFFKNGKCLSGKSCKYSHDLSEHYHESSSLGTTPNNTICKYYIAGYCKSGSKCAFQHDSNATNNQSPPQSQQPTQQPQPQQNNQNNSNQQTNNNFINGDKKLPTIITPIQGTIRNNNTNNSFNTPEIYTNILNNNNNNPTNQKTIINGFPIPTLPILETITNNNNLLHQQGFNSPLTPKTLQQQGLFLDEQNSFLNHHHHHSLPVTPTSTSSLLHHHHVDTIQSHSNHNHNTTTIQLSKSPLLNQTGSMALSPTRNLQFTNSLSFLPNSPRNSNVLSSSPSSPFSPQFHNGSSLLSSSPSPFFAAPIPIGGFNAGGITSDSSTAVAVMVDDDLYDDDDDDDQLNDPSGLIIIDDNYDDNVFDPFEYREIDSKNYLRHSEEILEKQKIQQQQKDNDNENELNNSNNNSSIDKDNTSKDNEEADDKSVPLSYLDALKLNLPADYYISYDNNNNSTSNKSSLIFTTTTSNGSDSTNTTTKTVILCHFYIQGSCRNGDTCKYVHGNQCQVCLKPMLIPGNSEQNAIHTTECLIAQEKHTQREEMKHLECGICFDSIVDKGRRFGLLSHCNHIFCLECIREWRGTVNPTTPTPTAPQSTTSVRLCPICRINSHFIIPADIFVGDEKKQEIIEIYKSKLCTIPCKYFNKGKGTCKFGTSCMYAHLNPDGTVYKPQVRKAQTSYGDVTIYSNQLGMFLPSNDDDDIYDEDGEDDEDSDNFYRKEGFELEVNEEE